MNNLPVKVAERAALAPTFKELSRAERRKLARRVGRSGCNGIGGRNGVAQERGTSFHGPLRLSKTIAHHSSEEGTERGHSEFLYAKAKRKLATAKRRNGQDSERGFEV